MASSVSHMACLDLLHLPIISLGFAFVYSN